MSINGAPVMAASVVAVDVGKNIAALTVTDADRHRLFGPVDFAMTAPVTRFVCGSPRTVGCGCGGRLRTGWWRRPRRAADPGGCGGPPGPGR